MTLDPRDHDAIAKWLFDAAKAAASLYGREPVTQPKPELEPCLPLDLTREEAEVCYIALTTWRPFADPERKAKRTALIALRVALKIADKETADASKPE
jgi:hypothetical protein